MKSDATFSDDLRYRYTLTREWGSRPPLVIIGLNPSTADAETDDPTIRRCKSFAFDAGHDGLIMLNLFAWRATDPRELCAAGVAGQVKGDPRNLETILEIATSRRVLCAWGAASAVPGHVMRRRVKDVVTGLERCRRAAGLPNDLWCLGTTSNGSPRHPLYVPRTQKLVPWPVDERRK